jgi:hypothetical protein
VEITKLLIKKILEHATHYEWELKGLGMMRTYLSEDTKIHVWDSRFKVPDVSLTHEHPWTFESFIIVGRLVNRRLLATPMLESAVDDPSTNPYMRSVVQCGPGGCLLAEPTLVHLHSPKEQVLAGGQRYQQRWDEIHQTYADDGTVTIVRRVDYKEPRAAAVYWPYGEEWVSSDPVMATPAKIQDIAENSLKVWFQ